MTASFTHPTDFNAALAPAVEWREAYAAVEREARALLILNGDPRENYTTAEMVEALYPEALARGDGITARKRIFKALAALATKGLADCATRGEPRKLRHANKMVRPWLWHAPAERNDEAGQICPHCGKLL
jgi:hypothetical protein